MSQKTIKSIKELRELFTRGNVGEAAKISGPFVRIFEVSMKSNKEFVFRDFHEQTCLESTQEYSYDTEGDVSDGEKIKTSKRPYSEAGDLDEGPIPKKRRLKEGEKATEEKKPEVVAHNSIADTLLCSICLDIFHDCVSLQPCTHTFCAACYTQSRDYSNYCPICRASIERVSNNFRVNDIVEAFLKEHPERRRSADELREMDSRKNIPEEMVVQEHRCTIL